MSILELPQEIVEKLLGYCDYLTLKNIRYSVTEWKQIVDYTLKKRIIAEIPQHTIGQIKNKWKGGLELEKLYDNWKCWEDIKENVVFEDNVFYEEKREHKYIFDISVVGDYVAIAFENIVELYEKSTYIKTFPFPRMEDDIDKIHLVCSDQCDSLVPTELLTTNYDEVYITDLRGACAEAVLESGNGFAAYRQYFYRFNEDAMIIGHVFKDECAKIVGFHVDLSLPVEYNSISFTCTSMSETKCILLIDNAVKIIYYKPGSVHHGQIIESTLQFTMDYERIIGYFRTWIVQDSIMLIMYWGEESDDQVFEIYQLTDDLGPTISPIKMYRPMDKLEYELNYICFYANTLLLCAMNGTTLFYEISDWNKFDITAYSKRIELTPLRPINSLDVSESNKERIFYIAGAHTILRLSGKTEIL